MNLSLFPILIIKTFCFITAIIPSFIGKQKILHVSGRSHSTEQKGENETLWIEGKCIRRFVPGDPADWSNMTTSIPGP